MEEDNVLGMSHIGWVIKQREREGGARFWTLKGEDLSFKNDLDPMATMQDELGLK